MKSTGPLKCAIAGFLFIYYYWYRFHFLMVEEGHIENLIKDEILFFKDIMFLFKDSIFFISQK